jgi:hypothetical protein
MLQAAPEVSIKANEETYQSNFTFLNFQEHADKDDFLSIRETSYTASFPARGSYLTASRQTRFSRTASFS